MSGFLRGVAPALLAGLLPSLLCSGLLLASPLAQSRTVLDLNAAKQPVALADSGDYWIDTSGQRTPEQVGSATDIVWAPTLLGGIYPLAARQTLWIRFTMPPAVDAERWLLEIPYPALDRASLYFKNSSVNNSKDIFKDNFSDNFGQLTEQRAGDLTAVNAWFVPHRHPILQTRFQADEPTRYLLRIENAQGFSAPLQFVNNRYVLRSEQQTSLFLGFYFGTAFLGCLIGLIGFIWLRERAYLYYSLCSALLGLTLAAITGAAALHLWPDSPNWADRSLSILGVWTLASVTLLGAHMVSLAQRSRALNMLVWAVALLGVVLSVLLGLTDSALRFKLFVPYVVLVPMIVLGINVWAWRHGDRYAGWLMLAALPFSISWAIATARYVGWLPLSFATEQGGLASMALQLPVFLVVLVLRSQGQRANRSRMLGLDRRDPTTGLINEQVFTERLLRMSARAERLKHHGAVLLIDVINTEQTRRDYGRKIADELPLRVASRLLSTTRDIDSVARLSERRFGMLVEGPISTKEADALGPRIVARCLMPFKGLHVECVAQVRIAYALVPYQGTASQSLMSKLEDRLTAASSADDKRAVFAL